MLKVITSKTTDRSNLEDTDLYKDNTKTKTKNWTNNSNQPKIRYFLSMHMCVPVNNNM